MDIAIEPRLKRFVTRKVKSGQFKTASEVVNFALGQLKDADRDVKWLADAVDKGVDSLDRGHGMAWDVEESKARLLRRVGRRRAGR